ncbi:WXG100 family type VII secretion target [Nonomuraea sp. NPDC049152]|uniref:WXG100 family type VII secretion target n=1 Tax=Nonomuraea sp. NPDC049152 TaxID=3154350 RepID=UPI00340850E4
MADHDIFDVTKINFAGLEAGETAFGVAFKELVAELEDLENQLSAKTAIWEGAAKIAYQEARVVWQTGAKDLADVVQLLSQNINITNMNMRDVERINTAMFDGK